MGIHVMGKWQTLAAHYITGFLSPGHVAYHVSFLPSGHAAHHVSTVRVWWRRYIVGIICVVSYSHDVVWMGFSASHMAN